MSLSKDTCLQCGQTRQEVKRNETYCATVTGYETVETRDEWEKHHWKNWSDAELTKMGIHQNFWEENRRTHIYDLEFPMRESLCLQRGCKYPKPWHPPMHIDIKAYSPENLCVCCYRERAEKTP